MKSLRLTASVVCAALGALNAITIQAQSAASNLSQYPQAISADYTVHNFHFDAGGELPDLRMHYVTLGEPRRNAAGHVDNAVILLHATISTSSEFLDSTFAGVLFGPGQLLDAHKYYILLPDSIGAGGSSKPSDGLHARFPAFSYQDMVRAQHMLFTEALHIDHARLILGTSMGGMHTFLWGVTYPQFSDALMPIACLPVEVAGRNRVTRQMIVDAIRNDPSYDGGEYKTEPLYGLRIADEIATIMVSSPLQMQTKGPTAAQTDQEFTETINHDLEHLDANNFLYLFGASKGYNPYPKLGSIQVPLTLVNSADDFIDPPELGIAGKAIQLIPSGQYVLLPITDQTRGHRTFGMPTIWQPYLKQLLERSEPKP